MNSPLLNKFEVQNIDTDPVVLIGDANLRSSISQTVPESMEKIYVSELIPFGILRHYGLQAKAGNVSGEVN